MQSIGSSIMNHFPTQVPHPNLDILQKHFSFGTEVELTKAKDLSKKQKRRKSKLVFTDPLIDIFRFVPVLLQLPPTQLQGAVCGSKGYCINTYGSYYCRCASGYDIDATTGKCRDVDECASGRAYCTYNCTNTEGSYQCLCPPGYEMVNQFCRDVNECGVKDSCPSNQTCFNTLGGVECIDGTCPNEYYTRTGVQSCRKKWCTHGDARCEAILVSSVKWVAYRLTSYHTFAFTYRMNGYAQDISFHFALVKGNEEQYFDVRRTGRGSVRMTSMKPLPAGRKFKITMHADVMRGRKLIERYVYLFYLFVSPYGF